MTLNLTVAANAARAIADEVIDRYDVNTGALTIAILQEIRRQERAYLDRLNDEANRNALIGPETESPV